MIDLHSHLLPAVDDGSRSTTETAEMLRIWTDFGFGTVAATHHYAAAEGPEVYIQAVARGVDEAGAVIDQSGLSVVIGAEIMLDPDLPNRLQRNERLTLGASRAVLVEVPFLTWPSYTEETMFALQLAGYQPVLAHPERYDAVQSNLSLATSLGERGVVLQVTYASLAGALGAPAKRAAERLVDRDLPVILASDAHGPRQRLLAIPDGLRRAEDLVGADRLRQMTTDIPASLLADRALPEALPAQPAEKQHGFLGRILRHG